MDVEEVAAAAQAKVSQPDAAKVSNFQTCLPPYTHVAPLTNLMNLTPWSTLAATMWVTRQPLCSKCRNFAAPCWLLQALSMGLLLLGGLETADCMWDACRAAGISQSVRGRASSRRSAKPLPVHARSSGMQSRMRRLQSRPQPHPNPSQRWAIRHCSHCSSQLQLAAPSCWLNSSARFHLNQEQNIKDREGAVLVESGLPWRSQMHASLHRRHAILSQNSNGN